MSEFEYGILFSALVIGLVLLTIEFFSGDVSNKFTVFTQKEILTVVKCQCGADYVFDLTPESPEKCPSCGKKFILLVSYKIKEIK